MDEYFTCEQCGSHRHINQLKKRNTMPGDYCSQCAEEEKCAACGEMFQQSRLQFKTDVRNYVCKDCETDYLEVMEYIKPLLPVFEIRRKAA